jgi:hypothetical protein
MRLHSVKLLPAAAALLAALPAAAFDPTGEVLFHIRGSAGTSAAFDGDRLVGPDVNLTRQDGGGWAGDLKGQNLDLDVTPKRVSGPNVNLVFSQKGGRTEIEGLFYGVRVRIAMDRKRLKGRIGSCSLDLGRKAPSLFHGDVGCIRRGATFPQAGKGALELSGEAANELPPLPQLAFALIAVLPG